MPDDILAALCPIERQRRFPKGEAVEVAFDGALEAVELL
jgi:hypothetical protein